MPALGSLWYTLGIDSKQIDADLKSVEAKLKNLGVTVDVSKVRQTIEASVGAAPFNATVNFGNARASLDAIFANKKYDVHVEAIASKLHESIKNALANFSTGANILPKKKELRKAVNDALLSAGFEINIGKVKGLNATINNALGSAHTLNVSVDPKKLASAIDKAVGAYKGGKQVSVEVKDKILKDSITAALKTEKFPIRVIVDKAEAQDAVRQALQAAGLQSSTGFTASDKRAWDAQSRRMEAEARVAAASALAQRRLAGARTQAANAADKHATATVSLNSALKGNITLTKELGGAIGAAYSVVALKNFMTKVVEIGGELEQQKLAMKAILGDEGMANTISSQINTLAVKSPFGIMELNQYAKQLTAFQIPYNELYDTMKRMADVSAAVGVDMGRIILAYGQVRAAKFLKGTELRQFTEANIPLIDMLAERFTKLKGEIVSAGDIMDMISNKEVSFEDVKAVLWELTGEGGRFYNMQEVLSESVSAKWKNLADAIDLMFADIANSTSGPLKGLAELLTALTSKWDYLGVAIASAAGVFGVAKVSTIAWNAALSKTTLSEIAQAKAAKQLEAANLQVASTYRTLTAAEQGLIRTKGKLTAAQYVQLANTGKLTKEEALRLIALKKLDANSIGHIRTVLNISKQEVAAAQATKAWRVRLEQLKVSIKGFGSSIAAFFMNPVTIVMAATGALMEAWYHMSEQSDKAEELGETLSTKAAEGARNLTEALRGLNGEFSNMNDAQLTQTIEKLEQLIKNYGLYAEKVLFYSYTDNKGVVRSMEERAEYLYEQAKTLETAYAKFKDWKVSDMIERGAKTTNGSFWSFNWTEGLLTDIEDYAEDVRNAQTELTEYLKDHEDDAKLVVKLAANIDPEFAKLTEGMGVEQAMNALVADFERLQKINDEITKKHTEYNALDNTAKADKWHIDFGKFHNVANQYLDNLTNTDIKHSMEEVMRHQDEYMVALKKEILSKDQDFFKNLTDEKKVMLGMAFQETFRGMEGLDYQYILPFVDRWNEFMGTAFDPSFIEGQIQSQFSSLIPTLGDELAQKVRNGEQLEQAEEDKVKSLFDAAVASVKNSWPGRAAEIQRIIDENPVYINAKTAVKDFDDKWQSEMNAAFSGNASVKAKIQAESDPASALKSIGELLKESQDKLNKNALILGITPQLNTPKLLDLSQYENDAVKKEAAERFNKAATDVLDITGQKKYNVTAFVKPRGGSGTPKDTLAESLKQRFKDIKDAWSEFQKWSKTEGREAAATRIGESGLFSTLSADKIPQTVEQYRALVVELENELRQAGVKGTARESLLNDLLKQLLDIDKTVVDEQLKLALDKVSKEAERQLADWNLFDKIRKATGDQDLAMSIAFGMNATAETDYPAMIKQQFNDFAKAAKSALTFDTATPELLANAPNEVKKAWEKAYNDIQKYRDKEREEVADMVVQYRNTQEEIIALTAEAEDKKRKIRESKNLTPVEKQQITAQIDADLNYEVFRKSGEYLKFFNAILSMTGKEAEDVGRKIKEALDEKLKAGRISAKDYCDEMEKIDKQLEKIRQKQKGFGGLGSFAKGGLQQMFKDRFDQAQSDYNAATQNQKDAADKRLEAEKQIAQFIQDGDISSALQTEGARMQAQFAERTAASQAEGAQAAMQGAQGAMSTVTMIDAIVRGINDTVQGIKGSFDLIADMADSFGVDTSADTGWGAAGAFLDAFSQASQHATDAWDSLKSGNVGGVIQGVVGSVTSWFTTFKRWHDAKLQKQIEQYQKLYDLLDNQLALISERLNFALGSARQIKDPQAEADKEKYYAAVRGEGRYGVGAQGKVAAVQTKIRYKRRVEAYEEGGAYAYQRELMREQRNSLIGQRNAETEKKDSDSDAIEGYNQQIAELDQQIRDFAESTIETLYGINIRGFAEDIGSALIDAFSKGEDAAEVFDKAVGDIMRDVVKQMAIKNILEKQFEGMRTFLFGNDGMSGAFGKDFYIDEEEAATLKEYFDKIKNEGIPAVKQLYDSVNDATGGMMDDIESAKNGLSAGIQSVTEDTADLLASYINQIRADVAMQTGSYWTRLLDDALPQMNVIAQSQLDTQRQIAENTLRNAVAAETIVQYSKSIDDRLRRAQADKSTGFWMK